MTDRDHDDRDHDPSATDAIVSMSVTVSPQPFVPVIGWVSVIQRETGMPNARMRSRRATQPGADHSQRSNSSLRCASGSSEPVSSFASALVS